MTKQTLTKTKQSLTGEIQFILFLYLVIMFFLPQAIFSNINYYGMASTTANTANINFPYTASTNANNILVFTASFKAYVKITNVQYAGKSFTYVTGTANSITAYPIEGELWYLQNPAAGPNNITVTVSAVAASAMGVAEYDGVSSIGAIGVSNNANVTQQALTTTVTTTQQNSVISGMYAERFNLAMTFSSAANERWDIQNTTNYLRGAGHDVSCTAAGQYSINYYSNRISSGSVMLELELKEALSPTSTSTVSPTSTPNLTKTITSTNTPTCTITDSQTYTITPTRTSTNSQTSTGTATFTNTPTLTETYSPTLSQTSTLTMSATHTWTATASNTPTETITPTSSETQTPTASATLTVTNTSTPTRTPTSTPTSTSTSTATGSQTSTESATFTATGTKTETQTASATSTAQSATMTPTATSNTETITESATETETQSESATSIATNVTQTETATVSSTINVQSSKTATTTQTPTINTATFTVTPAITSTPTFTSTQTTTAGNIIQIVIYDTTGQIIRTLSETKDTIAPNNFSFSESPFIADGSNVLDIIDNSGNIIGVWNGRNDNGNMVYPGTYRVKVTINSSNYIIKDITVVAEDLLASAQVQVRYSSNNIMFFINANARWGKVKIYNISAELIKIIYPASGAGNAVWDITTSGGKKVSKGLYVAVIELTNPDTGAAIHKLTKLAVH